MSFRLVRLSVPSRAFLCACCYECFLFRLVLCQNIPTAAPCLRIAWRTVGVSIRGQKKHEESFNSPMQQVSLAAYYFHKAHKILFIIPLTTLPLIPTEFSQLKSIHPEIRDCPGRHEQSNESPLYRHPKVRKCNIGGGNDGRCRI